MAMKKTNKKNMRLLTYCLLILAGVSAVLYMMGLMETFGVFGFVMSTLIISLMIIFFAL